MSHDQPVSPLVACDFETFYDSRNGYSLSVMTPHTYVHDPRFDPYLVAIVHEDGTEYIGSPLAYDWAKLAGSTLVMHNAAFDGLVLTRLIETGRIPDFPRQLLDTADLVAYMGVPRSLKASCKYLLGVELSKAVRTKMDGRTYASLTTKEKQDLIAYAADDSRFALRLCQAFSGEWPAWERAISHVNREAGWRGVRVDLDAVKAGLVTLRSRRDLVAKQLPWGPTKEDLDGKTGSRAKFILHAQSLGLPVPRSLQKTDPEMQAWVAKYGEKYPFIKARMDYVSILPHIARLEAIVQRADAEEIMRFESKYYGAHTGRCSGKDDEGGRGARFNIYNIPKGDKDGLTHGVNLRGLLIPRPGYRFMIYDFSQIEARIVQWIAGNRPFLKLVETENIYQAAAKRLGWCPESETALKDNSRKTYELSKACTLGLGFMMGAAKFALTCERMRLTLPSVPRDQWGLDRRLKFTLRNVARLSPDDPAHEARIGTFLGADKIVRQWREANPQVVELWARLNIALREAADKQAACHYFLLPSGRRKPYWTPRFTVKAQLVYDADTGTAETRLEKRLTASLIQGEPPTFLHGGVITENLVQSIARDIMFQGALDILHEAPSWHYVFNCYDELVFEVPLSDVARAEEVIPALLCRGSVTQWTEGLPIGVEGGPADRYTKSADGWRAWPPPGGWPK